MSFSFSYWNITGCCIFVFLQSPLSSMYCVCLTSTSRFRQICRFVTRLSAELMVVLSAQCCHDGYSTATAIVYIN